VRAPKAFLFDEPLSNLDARLREQMRYEIRKLQRELGTTSIYVTHDQIEAMTMADRIVAMYEGVTQQIGTPAELYDDPANLFVAGFMGSPAMNFIEVALIEEADGVAVMMGRERLGKIRGPLELREDRRAIVGIRPERIELASASLGLPGQIEMIEPTGLGLVLHLNVSGQPLKAFTAERLDIQVNGSIGMAVAPAALLLFDPDSGTRIRPGPR
jgi:multiple sugar transport system ATP-binding protein